MPRKLYSVPFFFWSSCFVRLSGCLHVLLLLRKLDFFPPSHLIFWFFFSLSPFLWMILYFHSGWISVSVLSRVLFPFSSSISLPCFPCLHSDYIFYIQAGDSRGAEINGSPSLQAPKPTAPFHSPTAHHESLGHVSEVAVRLTLISPSSPTYHERDVGITLWLLFLVWVLQMFLEPNSTFQLLWKKNLQVPSHICRIWVWLV